MNWLDPVLSPLQWVLLGLIPPLIFLLYFLKLRRTPLEVPSTYLWTKTVEDLHVNSIWQRLRNNLLLLLQLLAVLLLMLACLQPGCQGEQLDGDRFIFLVDQSASMSATDGTGGTTRLEDAKQQVINLIDRMKPSDAAMLISFSDRSIVQQSYTKNKSLLKRKVRSIRQTQRSSDINEALLAASGLANPGRTSDRNSSIDVQVADALAAKLYILSDGAVREVPNFSLGNLTPEYQPVGSLDIPVNIGITAFSINDQMDVGDQVQIFARLQNSGMEDRSVDVSLYIADKLSDARGDVNVPGLGSASIQFDLTALMPALETATPIRLEIEDDDIYLQDNTAFCILNPPTIAKVLIVSDFNKYLELVTKTDRISKIAEVQFEDRDYLKEKEFVERSTLGLYDLIIFDQCAPEKLPLCNTVFWGSIPRGGEWRTLENLETTPIVDVNSSHPLMFAVQMGTVNIVTSQTIEGPPGSLSLVDSPSGSIMMIGPRGGFEDLVIGFPLIEYRSDGDTLNNTDWPRKLSFPLFVQNLMSILGGGAKLDATRGNTTGQPISFRTQVPYPMVTVHQPDSQKTEVLPRSDRSFVFSQTDQTGVYEVVDPNTNEVDQLFAVNLFDRTESDLAVRDSLKLGYEEIKSTAVASKQVRKDYWPYLVLLALVVITIEWIIYNRRVFI